VVATEAEIVVLQAYLPAGLSPAELNALVGAAVLEAGAKSPADMGKVMKLLYRVSQVAPRVIRSAPRFARLCKNNQV